MRSALACLTTLICISSFVLSGHAQASADSNCAKLSKVDGSSCDTLDVRLDISSCDETEKVVTPTVKCNDGVATLRFQTQNFDYKAKLVSKPAGWGKVTFVQEGSIRRKERASKAKTAATQVQLAPPEPAPAAAAPQAERAPASAIPVLPPTPPAMTEKPKDEDIANLLSFFSGFNFKGSIDAYYAGNFNGPPLPTAIPTAAAPQVQNKYHVFDTYHDDLQLSYARFQIQKVTPKLITTLDLAYGPSMQIVSGTKTDSAQFNVKQAIIGYKPNDQTTIEVGRFVTFLGFELIESQDNWNYSRGILFGYFVPFWHQGAKTTYAVNDQVSVMGVVANGWNNSYDDNKQKVYGAQVGWTPSKDFVLYVSAITGQDAVASNVNAATPQATRTVFDLVSTFKVNNNLSLAVNFDHYQHDGAKGLGLATYARYSFDEAWAAAARVEYIEDKDNLALGESVAGGQNLQTYTLTVENKLTPNLLLRLEGRVDASSAEVFIKNGSPTGSQTVGILGLTASF